MTTIPRLGQPIPVGKAATVDVDVEDPELDARLRNISARLFVALGGASFGRCDIRVDKEGTPFMLEINPNCGVYYPPTDPGSADICLAMDPEGHEGFTRKLVRAAFRRHELRRRRRQEEAARMRARGERPFIRPLIDDRPPF